MKNDPGLFTDSTGEGMAGAKSDFSNTPNTTESTSRNTLGGSV